MTSISLLPLNHNKNPILKGPLPTKKRMFSDYLVRAMELSCRLIHISTKEKTIVLTMPPYNQRTHWSQTIFTFQEPIAMALPNCISDPAGALGTNNCPVEVNDQHCEVFTTSEYRCIDGDHWD